MSNVRVYFRIAKSPLQSAALHNIASPTLKTPVVAAFLAGSVYQSSRCRLRSTHRFVTTTATDPSFIRTTAREQAAEMTLKANKFTPEVLLSAPRRSAGAPNGNGTKILYTVSSTLCFDIFPWGHLAY